MTIKDLVSGNNRVRLLFYRKKELWYEVIGVPGGNPSPATQQYSMFVFPVPIDDCGDATFLPEDKAILFMRYIRKELEVRKFETLPIEVQMQKTAELRSKEIK